MLGAPVVEEVAADLEAADPVEPTTEYLPPPPTAYDAPPPPPPGWTLADGPGRAALLPPPPRPKGAGNPTALTMPAPKNKGGCGCAVVAAIVGLGVVAAISGGIFAISEVTTAPPGERLVGPTLSLGSIERFELDDDDTGVHALDLGEGAVTITVTSRDDDFDPVLRLVDASGTEVGRNDDADGYNSRLSFTLGSSGSDLVAEVTEFSGDPGEYEIAVRSGATPPVLDPDDPVIGERVAAEELIVGDAVQRFLGSDDTAVHPLAGFEGRVTITVHGLDGFDPMLRVVDSSGAEVAQNDDFDGQASLVTFVLSTSDRYEVEVVEFSGDAGFYSILLQRGDGTTGSPPVLGEVLGRGEPVLGEVGREQAVLHDFTGDGGEIVVTVEGQLGFDPVVRVLDAGGDVLAENDDSDGLDSRVALVVGEERTVTIEVTGFGGEPGRYRVLVA